MLEAGDKVWVGFPRGRAKATVVSVGPGLQEDYGAMWPQPIHRRSLKVRTSDGRCWRVPPSAVSPRGECWLVWLWGRLFG